MRRLTLVCVGLTLSLLIMDSSAFAQSGSRPAPRPSGGSSAPSSGSQSGGGGGSGGGSSSRGGSGVQLTDAQLQALGEFQRLEQKKLLEEFQKRQAEQERRQLKSQLNELGNNPNGKLNKRQTRLAFKEAKRDFAALRKKKVSPNEIQNLQPLFRLGKDAIDRSTKTANWPKALQSEAFAETISKIDSQMSQSEIKDDKSAKKFLGDLAKLNQSLNSAAASGNLNVTNYIKARQFITGLANEIRASNVLDVAAKGSSTKDPLPEN